MSDMILPIVSVPESTQVWFVRAGARGLFWDDFRINEYIAVENYGVPLLDLNSRANKNVQQNYRNAIFARLTAHMTPDEIKEKRRNLNVSAGRKASVLRNFRDTMKVGDLVFCPGPRTRDFLVGLITSGVSNTSLDRKRKEVAYPFSTFGDKRQVDWLKIVDFSDIPDDIRYIRHGNGSIFQVTEYIDEVLPIAFNNYRFRNRAYSRIDVATADPVTSDDLLDFQTVISLVKHNSAINVNQKTKIASPGHVLLATAIQNQDALLSIVQSLGVKGIIAVAITAVAGNADKIGAFIKTIATINQTRKMNAALIREKNGASKLSDEQALTEAVKRRGMELDNQLKQMEIDAKSKPIVTNKDPKVISLSKKVQTKFQSSGRGVGQDIRDYNKEVDKIKNETKKK